MEQEQQEQKVYSFNPNEHVIQLKSKQGSQDYLPVQWRLVWFREQCPQGTIDTEEVQVDMDREIEVEAYVWNNEKRRSEKTIKRAKGYARFRAIVTDGKGGRATGTKSESAANFPDFIEKAETGAIGRALAALGYGTQFAPDLDEEHRIVDAPVERSAPAQQEQQAPRVQSPAPQQQPPLATNEQKSSIEKLASFLGKEVDFSSLSYEGAKQCIRELTAQLREQRASGAAKAPHGDVATVLQRVRDRAESLQLNWPDTKTDTGFRNWPDEKLTLASLAKIDGHLTEFEKNNKMAPMGAR